MTEEIIIEPQTNYTVKRFYTDKEYNELEQENKSLYEEKNCLHKIIDRLLENAGYSKDIASAEDFEDVYEDMQIKRNELIELEQENKELREMLSKEPKAMQAFQIAYSGNKKENETLWGMVKDYKSALEEIIDMFLNQVALVGPLTNFEQEIYNKINEVLK